MSIEAMKQALEALEKCMYPQLKQLNAITSLRQAIEQADKQEPVGEVIDERGNVDYVSYVPSIGTKLYTTPQPQREWVGLTDEEIDQGLLRSDYALQTAHAWRAGVVFAMTQLKEKNT